MNNFEEHKAEIFRRAEKLAASRRKSRRVAALLVPCICFAVCLCVVSAFYGKNLSVSSDSNGGGEVCSPRMTITGFKSDDTVVIDSSDDIKAAADILKKLTDSSTNFSSDTSVFVTDGEVFSAQLPSTSESYGAVMPIGGAENEVEDEAASQKYTIEYTDENGEYFSYTLEDNRLTDNESGAKVYLTDSEIEELLNLFD